MNKALTLGMGLTFNGLRVAISVKFQKFPVHHTRKVSVTVGGLCVFEAMWDAAGKEGALEALKAIGEEVAELSDSLKKVEV